MRSKRAAPITSSGGLGMGKFLTHCLPPTRGKCRDRWKGGRAGFPRSFLDYQARPCAHACNCEQLRIHTHQNSRCSFSETGFAEGGRSLLERLAHPRGPITRETSRRWTSPTASSSLHQVAPHFSWETAAGLFRSLHRGSSPFKGWNHSPTVKKANLSQRREFGIRPPRSGVPKSIQKRSKNHCQARVQRTSSRFARLSWAYVRAMRKAAALRKAETLSKLMCGEQMHEQVHYIQTRQHGAKDCRTAKPQDQIQQPLVLGCRPLQRWSNDHGSPSAPEKHNRSECSPALQNSDCQ